MASYQVLNHSHHQVRDSCSTQVRHGYSKAQMCLNKILGIISSIPPQETPKESQDLETKRSENNNNRGGVGIDLNLRLGPLVESEEEEEESLAENGNNLSACSVVVGKVSSESTDSVAESAPAVHVDHVVAVAAEKSSESECDPKEKLAAEKAVEVSEITTQQQRVEESSEIDDDDDEVVVVVKTVAFKREENENKSTDCLSLLVEAARLISGNFEEEEEEEEDDESPSHLHHHHHQRKATQRRVGFGVGEIEEEKEKEFKEKQWRYCGGLDGGHVTSGEIETWKEPGVAYEVQGFGARTLETVAATTKTVDNRRGFF
ncbi:hypothetical protein CMV_022830 [Castanea mollissima]|uniref:Uncharacterized protein n=1 Tax=Castanea mollissima TaxID=60419 RepID=A0A8J4QH89_9ROSI|nr:hypothetical protein CMV_022830 [Castanea mollissima]